MNAQTKIKDGSVSGTAIFPVKDAVLELESSNRGLLYPRVALTSTDNPSPLSAHVKGMVVYDTATAGTGVTAVSPGLYYNDGGQWVRIGNAPADWYKFGTVIPAANTDSQYVMGSVAIGQNSAATASSGTAAKLTVVGGDAVINTLTVGKGGGQVASNTAVGDTALFVNTTGANNTALGYRSLDAVTTGAGNTAAGSNALGGTTTGTNNTAFGDSAGINITSGSTNIAIGSGQNVASATTSNQLNIGGAIFGTGLNGSATSPAGNIGIGNVAPSARLTVDNQGSTTTPALQLKAPFSGAALTDSLLTWGPDSTVRKIPTMADWRVFGSTATPSKNGLPANNTDSQYVMGRVAINTNAAARVAADTSGSTAVQRFAVLTVAGGDAAINTLTVGKGGGQQSNNTAVGFQALNVNTTGVNNTAVGSNAGGYNKTGRNNTFVGYNTGLYVTSDSNTFVGAGAGQSWTRNNTAGTGNTVVGAQSGILLSSTAKYNVVIGAGTQGPGIGSYNITIGTAGPYGGYDGSGNLAMGAFTGGAMMSHGNYNTLLGYSIYNSPANTSQVPAGVDPVGHNVAIGYKVGYQMVDAFPYPSYNIYIGDSSGTNDGSTAYGFRRSTIIGKGQNLDNSDGTELYKLNIMGGIFGTGLSGNQAAPAGSIGIAAIPNPSYALTVGGDAYKTGGTTAWAISSDSRIKTDVENFTDGLNVITKLKPVTYRYNAKSGNADLQKKYVGFIAQDVESVAPYMVTQFNDTAGSSHLADRRVLDVSPLNQILVNAVQEQQKEIEALKKEIEALKELIKK